MENTVMTENDLDWELERREEAYCEIERLEEAKFNAMYKPFQYNAPYNTEFLGAQPAKAGEDY
tara:strand:- start:98 stop:286 length:189 start_codon:yes stop_codon:yes gene_type:complete